MPPTDAQAGALRTLGLDPSACTAAQAGLLLAARDYADRIMRLGAPGGWDYKETRLTLISYMVERVDHVRLLQWSVSQMRRGDDANPKRIPADDVRTLMRAKLASMRTGGAS